VFGARQTEVQVFPSGLTRKVNNKEYIELEGLAKKFNVSKTLIHKAITNISNLPGWSFTPSNYSPYAKLNHLKRNRKKGEKYIHDSCEEDWRRTYYYVRKPVE